MEQNANARLPQRGSPTDYNTPEILLLAMPGSAEGRNGRIQGGILVRVTESHWNQGRRRSCKQMYRNSAQTEIGRKQARDEPPSI